jgi:predicted benzoate:H+ symporter BenE
LEALKRCQEGNSLGLGMGYGVRIVYASCAYRVPIVYGWCTYLVLMVYAWCT